MRNTAMRISLVLTVALATGPAQGEAPPDKAALPYLARFKLAANPNQPLIREL